MGEPRKYITMFQVLVFFAGVWFGFFAGWSGIAGSEDEPKSWPLKDLTAGKMMTTHLIFGYLRLTYVRVRLNEDD